MRLIQHAARLFSWATAVVLLATGVAGAGDRVYPTPDAVEPLAPGTRVPSARVETVGGDPVDLLEVVRNRGALLVFYRGGW
jgi:hypothetical protein